MTDDAHLLAALAVIRARGAIGERSLADAVAHADRFANQIPAGPRSVIDLGSGGGLPALVIAWRRLDLTVTMVERRAARADLLRRAASSLAVGDRAVILNLDVDDVCKSTPRSFDVVTARSFGDVATTAGFIDRLLAPGGLALISEPPVDRGDLWSVVLGQYSTLVDDGVNEGIRRLRRPR